MAPSQVSGALEHQHTHEHFDVTMLMQDPELAQAAESLALALLEPEPGVYQNPVYPKALR